MPARIPELATVLDELSPKIVAAIGAVGTLEVPLNNAREPEESLSVTHGGLIVPDLTRSAYRDLSWRNQMRITTGERHPDPSISSPETTNAYYTGGVLVLRHTVSLSGEEALRQTAGPGIDWPKSTAYIFSDKDKSSPITSSVLGAYEVVNDEQTGLIAACMKHAEPMELSDAEYISYLWDRAQQLRTDQIAAL